MLIKREKKESGQDEQLDAIEYYRKNSHAVLSKEECTRVDKENPPSTQTSEKLLGLR